MLCMVNAASSTAVPPPPGMPSAKRLTMEPPSELELADSDAATPCGLPLPKLSGLRLARLVKGNPQGVRSEEHTSELQSLMRISYAVFCLKKKKQMRNNTRKEEKETKKHKSEY